MSFKQSILYILSGTGNTFRVGCWIKEMMEEKGCTVQVEMSDEADPHHDLQQSQDQLLGFLFPTHGFMPPWSMIKFLFRFPRSKGSSVFCAATRGSIFFGPIRIPGASGFATFLAALILFIKGYKIKGIFSLDMPSNFINFHWGLHPKNSEKIITKSKEKLHSLMERLNSGKHIYFTLNNLWETFWTVFILWLVPIFPIIYLIFGRLFMAKLMFSNNNCVGCGLCAKSCGNQAIKMIKVGSRKYPFWTYHCENCLRCMAYCNKKAVEAGHSWAVALFYITSVPVVFWISIWFHEQYPGIPRISNFWLNEFLTVFYFFPALILAYRVFWFLIRIKPINTLFTYTTLTRYFRRYREPSTKLKQMTLLSKRNKTKESNS